MKLLLLTTKSVHVEGLPILLEALREPIPDAKGKGKEISVDGNREGSPRRRGIVTGGFSLRYVFTAGRAEDGVQYAITVLCSMIPWSVSPCLQACDEGSRQTADAGFGDLYASIHVLPFRWTVPYIT